MTFSLLSYLSFILLSVIIQCQDECRNDCELATGPGCPSNLECEAAVCDIDSFCCNTNWDDICEGEEFLFPNECCIPTRCEINHDRCDLRCASHYFRCSDSLILPNVYDGRCLQENEEAAEYDCTDTSYFSQNDLIYSSVTEQNCEAGLCCDSADGTCKPFGWDVENFTFDPTNGPQCSELPDFCRGTIYNSGSGLYCSCRENCDLVGNCCDDASSTCQAQWDNIIFCEEREIQDDFCTGKYYDCLDRCDRNLVSCEADQEQEEETEPTETQEPVIPPV